MSLEKKILSSCIHSRAAFEKMSEHLEGRIGLPISDIIIEACREYYARDGNAKSVDSEWLNEKIGQLFDNQKKANEYQGFINELSALDVSSENIAELILDDKRKTIREKLAVALANDSKDVADLIDEYNKLGDKETENEEDNVLHNISIEDSVKSVLDKSNLIRLPTKALNEAVEGGALPGHHIVVAARPETGKTALCTSFIRAFCYQGLPGIYFGNEDPIRQIVLRAQTCFTGLTRDQLREDSSEAQRRLESVGWDLARFIPLSPGSPREIEKYVKMYKPSWIIVDQLRNLNVRSDTRVNQLEAAATAIRNIANQYGLVAISVTQAGDSADNKLVLGMGDIDFSNTGIPAQADLMVMMGVDKSYEEQNLRMINLPKNKLSGKHLYFPLRIIPQISRLEDV